MTTLSPVNVPLPNNCSSSLFKSGHSCWILTCRSSSPLWLMPSWRSWSIIAISMLSLNPDDMVLFILSQEQSAGFSILFVRSAESR